MIATGNRSLSLLRNATYVAGAALCLAGMARAAEPLSDAQLEAITAGAAADNLDEIVVNATRTTARGSQVAVDGKLSLRQVEEPGTASLLLRDSAQSNLQSMINFNAVQSVVNVLVNLNISINSQIGQLQQLNVSGAAGP